MNHTNIEIKEVKNDKFNVLHSKMIEYIEQKKLPCVITLVYQNDEIIYCGKQGMADIENNVSIEFDTIFRIASMTKPIVSVAALMLYEEGKFSLDDPLSKFMPKAKDLKVFVKEEAGKFITEELNREVTIRDLFTHTGGFSYLGDVNHPVDKKYAGLFQEKNHKTLADGVNALFDVPLLLQPGTIWKYSLSTDILGYLIEIISGKSLDKFLRERIFNKLEMKDTGFFVPEEKWDRLASIYMKNGKGELVKVPEDQQRYGRNKTSFFSGGGGLSSTLADYLKFAVALLNNGKLGEIQLVKEETIKLMTQDHVLSRGIQYINKDSFGLLPKQLVKIMLEITKGMGFGLGVKIQLEDGAFPAGCYGWGGAFTTDYLVDPKNNMVSIFLSQHLPNLSFTEYYAISFRKFIYEGVSL